MERNNLLERFSCARVDFNGVADGEAFASLSYGVTKRTDPAIQIHGLQGSLPQLLVQLLQPLYVLDFLGPTDGANKKLSAVDKILVLPVGGGLERWELVPHVKVMWRHC